MKKEVTIAFALLVGSFTFAQKSELKDAEKAIKKSNYAEAKSAINAAEALIANADDKMKANFYFLKGQALYANGTGSSADMDAAMESLNMVEKVEGSNGKYAQDVQDIKEQMLSSFLTNANAALEKKNYAASSSGFDKAYRMSTKDTLYLYYAAATAVNGEDYDNALKYYEELKDLGYVGIETDYVAINKETSEEESFPSKSLMDISVKAGTHIKPSTKLTESKQAEIVKNIALIYMSNGDNEKAIAAMQEARKANPDDTTLIISEANMQLQMGNKEAFKSLIEEALVSDPNNPELLFNLGIVSAEGGDAEAAKGYYEKALQLKPDYTDVHNNMAVLILSQEQALIEEMNALGSSAADNKKYDQLKEQRSKLYADAIPYLETTLKLRPTDLQAAKTLVNIYSALGETEKMKEMKAKVEALEGGQ
ncbi:tetratricopeptide repeat protein [Gelidibacter salicanalis]|uniref:Tetratricopeptide repeat protein n=1 Tax=Gelidibacter salicanalis TaxID=291193 RepID=A0A934KS23_9FLAO|nr:tetratricopeptide repeat protein [Gelidibacter salicanalis]MBJ7880376.1 tetratricopeptide repeat protein [Gelidibacter salicanalis]